MTTAGVFATPSVDVPRHRGDKRPKILLPEYAGNAELAGAMLRGDKVPTGVAAYYTRATTYAGTVDDRNALERWMKRQVAIGMTLRPALLKAFDLASAKGDKRAMDDVCDQAMEAAGSKDSASVGTTMHDLTELHDRGVPVDVADETMRADLAAYIAATSRLKMLATETFVVNDDYRIAGTFDRLVEFQGQRLIADLKTGASMAYGIGTIAQQLAVYANGSIYDPLDGTRTPHGARTDWAVIIHLPQGEARCELLWLDIAAGWKAIELSRGVREWRSRKDLTRPMLMSA